MKGIAKQINRVIFALILPLVAVSCVGEDDINAIFRERDWKLTYIKEGSVQRYAKDKIYSIEFLENTFTATTPKGVTITGNWHADGSALHSFECNNIRTNGNLSGDTIGLKMRDILKNAKTYSGDTNWLQIKQQDNVYIQFYN
ncbi:MAG: hypothetical protein J6U58_06825 [Bacteroidaceae bacterium]|nr:hypothetical protein [Bacteroidaceae bacterium]